MSCDILNIQISEQTLTFVYFKYTSFYLKAQTALVDKIPNK